MCIRDSLYPLEKLVVNLGFVTAVGLQLLFLNTQLLGDLCYWFQDRLLRNLNIDVYKRQP